MYFGVDAPWNDVRVRKAISLAIDRDQWLAFYRISGYEGDEACAHNGAWHVLCADRRRDKDVALVLRQPKDEDVAEANRLMDEVFGAGNRPLSEVHGSDH